ncbi:hypothetical protein GCM10029964_125730 [Kibdelosporangium lantanae]
MAADQAHSQRRANASVGSHRLTQGYPLRYAPRWSNDPHPWVDPFSRLRWANDEVNERGAA